MDNIDKLLKHITDNTDQIIDSIKYNDLSFTEEEFENALLELIEDGEVEVIEEDGILKYKLTDK